MASLERLSPTDLTNLASESRDGPMHQAAFAVLDGGRLLDSEGHLRIDEVRQHLSSRLDRVPELRRVLRRTTPPEGPPLWVDDPEFRIENHVRAAALPAPGGLAAGLEFVEARMAELMDRSRPLWELWFLEGYGRNQVGLVVKLHHALADGPAMVNLFGQIFDLGPDAVDDPPGPWIPSPPPSRRALVRDNLAGKAGWFGRAGRRLRHPVKLARSTAAMCRGALVTTRQGWGAPRTSLNRPIGLRRRVAVTRLSLAEVKAVAHAAGVKLNDVFLCIVAGGLRRVLEARGEDTDGEPLRASIAVSLHQSDDGATAGNLVGTVLVPLPLGGLDTMAALARIASASVEAKAKQRAVVSSGAMVLLARMGVTRQYIRHQHLINVLTTNLPGPPVPLYFAGARITDAFALPPIAGNVTVSFAALSYAGNLSVSVVADSATWPDLDVLMDGIRDTWEDLRSSPSSGLTARGRTALSA